MIGWEWSDEQFAGVLWLRECGEDAGLSGGQLDGQDWADVQIAGDVDFWEWSAAFDFCGEVSCPELQLQAVSGGSGWSDDADLADFGLTESDVGLCSGLQWNSD
ncbi:MAG: hypothetical protein ACKON9_19015, partial [Planctomycetaceae bacterium]